jgi:hypothetical protein
MLFYPTPLFKLNKGMANSSLKKLTSKSDQNKKAKAVKADTVEEGASKANLDLNESCQNLNDVSVNGKHRGILSNRNIKELNLNNRTSMDSSDLNLLDIEAVIARDKEHYNPADSQSIDQIVINSDRHYTFESNDKQLAEPSLQPSSVWANLSKITAVNNSTSSAMRKKSTPSIVRSTEYTLYVDANTTLQHLEQNPGLRKFLLSELKYDPVILTKPIIKLSVFWYLARLSFYNIAISSLNLSGNICSVFLVLLEIAYLSVELFNHI